MSIGISVNGYPAGGDQQGAGEDWAIEALPTDALAIWMNS